MNYTKMLNKLIDNSGKMQKDIAKECTEKYGINLTNTYLSTLKTTEGKRATDEISRAIANVCGAKYENILVVQGYLDKAPETIIKFIEAVKEDNNTGVEILENMGMNSNPMGAMIMAAMKEKKEQSLAEYVCERVAESETDKEDNFISIMEKWQQEQEEKWLVIPPEGVKNAKYISERDMKKIIKKDPTE